MKKRLLMFLVYISIFILITMSLFSYESDFLCLFVSYLFFTMALVIKLSVFTFCSRFKTFKIFKIDVNIFTTIYLLLTIVIIYSKINLLYLIIIDTVLFIITIVLILFNRKNVILIKDKHTYNIKDSLFNLFINEENAKYKQELSKMLDKYNDSFVDESLVSEIDAKINNKINEYNLNSDKLFVIKEIDLLLTIRNSIIQRAN